MSFRNKGTVGPTVIVSMEPDRSGNFICSGVADDVQIQQAIDYIETLGGGSVLLGAGTYDITANLTIYAGGNTAAEGLLLEGVGPATILRPPNNHVFPVFAVSAPGNAVYNVHFKKFKIYSESAFNTANGDGVELNFAYDCSLDAVHAEGLGLHGLSVEACYAKVTALNCKFAGNMGSGVFGTTANILDILSCEIHNNTQFGVWIASASEHVRIIDNDITWNEAHGVWISAAACHGIVILGNNFYHNASDNADTYDNVNITDGYLMNISDNVFFDDEVTDTARSNVYLDGADRIVVADNVMSLARSDGIFLVDAEDCSITGNIVEGSDGFDINVSNAGCLRTLVKDNRLLSATKFQDGGTDTAVPETLREVTDPDSNVGDHPTLVLPDTVDTTFRFQVPIPLEFQELVTAQVIVVQTSTGGPPDMQWSTTTDWGKLCAAEDYNDGSDAETDQTTAVAQNELVCIDVSASLTGIAAGDLVGFTFIRRASQAGDDIDADAYYLGFRLRYV